MMGENKRSGDNDAYDQWMKMTPIQSDSSTSLTKKTIDGNTKLLTSNS